MEAKASDTALQRKMAAGRDGTRKTGRSALRALRLGLARSAADLFDMPLSVIGAVQTRSAQDALAEHLRDDRLLLLLDGPDGRVGGASVDRGALAALIQQQTTGRVLGGDPGERPFTATDAAMVAPLMDEMLARAGGIADSALDRKCLDGYRFGARAEDMRSLMLAVEAERFRVFDLTLEFEGGLLQGAICLVLPDIEAGQVSGQTETVDAGPRLEQSLSTARANLMAVVGRLRLSLSDLGKMQAGDILPLNRQRLDQAELIAIDGRRVAAACLGQSGGLWAVRLNEVAAVQTAPQTAGRMEFQALIDTPGIPASAHADDTTHDLPPARLEEIWPTPDPVGAAADVDGLTGLQNEETESDFLNLSPEDAAAEISELAGLSLEDEGQVPAFDDVN
ncbi:FliM/FliN family flagellar motor C-terminal domain-containing protein [Arenibacterium sp. CAU 1754]